MCLGTWFPSDLYDGMNFFDAKKLSLKFEVSSASARCDSEGSARHHVVPQVMGFEHAAAAALLYGGLRTPSPIGRNLRIWTLLCNKERGIDVP